MDDYKKWEKEHKFRNKTCDALILQFKEPYKYDLEIPPFEKIVRGIIVAGRILNKQDLNLEEMARQILYGDLINNRFEKEYFNGLSKRVHNGIAQVLMMKDRYTESHLRWYLNAYEQRLGRERISGEYDPYYRFRKGEREKTQKEVQEYFAPEEIKDFERIGNLFRDYIRLV